MLIIKANISLCLPNTHHSPTDSKSTPNSPMAPDSPSKPAASSSNSIDTVVGTMNMPTTTTLMEPQRTRPLTQKTTIQKRSTLITTPKRKTSFRSSSGGLTTTLRTRSNLKAHTSRR